MPDFDYIAREFSGKEVAGVLTAGNPTEAASVLASRNLFPTSITPAKPAQPMIQLGGGRIKPSQLSVVFSQIADLLHSGVPLLRSLDILIDQSNHPRLKGVLQDVRSQVSEGVRMAEALRRHPSAFNELAVSMVRAGEEGGFLEDALQRIAVFTEQQEDLKGRVVGAMMYPMFLLFTCVAVVTVMLVFLVPQFAPIFEGLAARGELPVTTQLLLAMSNFIQGYGIVVAAALAGGIWYWRNYAATESGRLLVDKLKIRTPGMGAIVRSLAIARFCRILGTLLKNGVPILNSLRIAKDATGNKVLAEAISSAADNISSGKSLARPLASSGQFSREVVEMITVGEEANNLEQVLLNIADNMERRTYRQLDLMVRLLEPAMLLLMAVLIGFVVIALLLPVFQGAGTIS